MAIEVGSTVYLKSGGPAMTVENMDDPNRIGVQWFVGSAYHAASFPPAALVDVDPTPAIEHTRQKERGRLQATD